MTKKVKTKIQHCQNLWGVAKAVLRGKFIAVNTYINRDKQLKSVT